MKHLGALVLSALMVLSTSAFAQTSPPAPGQGGGGQAAASGSQSDGLDALNQAPPETNLNPLLIGGGLALGLGAVILIVNNQKSNDAPTSP